MRAEHLPCTAKLVRTRGAPVTALAFADEETEAERDQAKGPQRHSLFSLDRHFPRRRLWDSGLSSGMF